MNKLKTLFGIDRLLLEGGGNTGATFVDAGLVDEYSLVVSPTIQGDSGVSLVEGPIDEVQNLTIVEQMQLSEGMWLRLTNAIK